jgi:DNA mismatch repair protein MutL
VWFYKPASIVHLRGSRGRSRGVANPRNCGAQTATSMYAQSFHCGPAHTFSAMTACGILMSIATIRKLPDVLINQIAAGEVVERPASVVKELVENACDAGASRIDVSVREGGTTLISISDDGRGMSEQDVVIAVERHATSKITELVDLEDLTSFGFRGEALPSIASISRLRIQTRTAESSGATELIICAGAREHLRPTAGAVGTRVEVYDLFLNVPARRKFLKSIATESAQITDVVLLAALCRSDITFTLTRDGKLVREYLRTTNREARVRDALKDSHGAWLCFERGPFRCEALLSPPDRARAGATGLHLFVNGRSIRDRSLARAVAQSYGSSIDSGRFPVGAIYIEIPGKLVDINVHPQKSEVRFQDARSVFEALYRGLSPLVTQAFTLPSGTQADMTADTMGKRPFAWSQSRPQEHDSPRAAPVSYAFIASTADSVRIDAPSVLQDEPNLFRAVRFYARLRYLAQLQQRFLLCEGEDGLYVLDQHTVDERVRFDDLRKSIEREPLVAQRLPEAHRFEAEEAALTRLETQEAALLHLGFEVRRTGTMSASVVAAPALLAGQLSPAVLKELLAHGAPNLSPRIGRFDPILAELACHSAVRYGELVTREYAETRLARLDDVDFAAHCPHGRPVVTRIGSDELERRAGR